MVGLFVGAAIIAWVSQKITRPIQELRQDVATIGAGNLEHRADIKTGDEIEELAAEFNKMTDCSSKLLCDFGTKGGPEDQGNIRAL